MVFRVVAPFLPGQSISAAEDRGLSALRGAAGVWSRLAARHWPPFPQLSSRLGEWPGRLGAGHGLGTR